MNAARTLRSNIPRPRHGLITSLDPTKTIGYQVAEPVWLHRGVSEADALDRAVEVLSLVGLPGPKEPGRDQGRAAQPGEPVLRVQVRTRCQFSQERCAAEP